MRRASIIFMLATIVAGWPALGAQDFSGSLESRLGWYWGSEALLPQSQTFEGRVDGKVGDQDLPSARYSVGARVAYDPASGATAVDLDEAWVTLLAGPFDVSVGNQVVAWSVSDAFTPSDLVNPLDLALPVDPIKKPVPMGRLVYNGSAIMVDLVAQPFWVGAVPPGEPWAASSQLPVRVVPVDLTWGNAALGGHVKASLGFLQGLDLGATLYRGRASIPTATVVLDASGTSPGSVRLDYDRLTLLAVDAVLAPGAGLLLKTEWGDRTLRDSGLLEPEAGAASLQGVSGLEYRLGQVQLIGEYVLDWAKGAARAGDAIDHSLVLIASMDLGGRTNVKVAGIHTLDGDGMVAPQASYTLADGLQFNCSMFFFYGAGASTYGAWKENALGRLSLKYSF